MTFSFVDRISEFVPETRARGYFTIPRNVPNLPPSLVAEAVGQLAAWVAMAKTEFRRRPVAGIMGEVKIMETAIPPTSLNLEVNVETCDNDAVLYNGQARAGNLPIIELSRCVGPMLPMEDFDDPDAMRQRFELLCGAGAPPQSLSADGTRSPDVVVIDRDAGRRLRAEMWVPRSAPYFADHFPRKPVLPGTLLLDAQIELAVGLAAEAVDPSVRALLRPTRVYNIKLRSFVNPGQLVEIGAEVLAASRASAEIALAAKVEGQRVSSARLETRVRGAS